MKILVTGSSGTIGTRLCEMLDDHHDVIGTDIKRNSWKPELNSRTDFVDLTKAEELVRLPSDVDMVIHFGANARVYDLVKKPELAMDNILMTFNVLEFMRGNGIGKIIFASSRETYGNIMSGRPVSEGEVRLENCESPYSASKITGEAMIQAYARVYDMGYVIVRFSNVYGMYDDSDRVVPLWIRQCLKGEDLVVYGKDKVLDFTYIDDAVDGVIRIIDSFDRVEGNTINLGSGKGQKLLDVATGIKSVLQSDNGLIMEENRAGEVWKYEADISKAVELLHYQPTVAIEEGLERTVRWYNEFGMLGSK